jgi:hypothetical protein
LNKVSQDNDYDFLILILISDIVTQIQIDVPISSICCIPSCNVKALCVCMCALCILGFFVAFVIQISDPNLHEFIIYSIRFIRGYALFSFAVRCVFVGNFHGAFLEWVLNEPTFMLKQFNKIQSGIYLQIDKRALLKKKVLRIIFFRGLAIKRVCVTDGKVIISSKRNNVCSRSSWARVFFANRYLNVSTTALISVCNFLIGAFIVDVRTKIRKEKEPLTKLLHNLCSIKPFSLDCICMIRLHSRRIGGVFDKDVMF